MNIAQLKAWARALLGSQTEVDELLCVALGCSREALLLRARDEARGDQEESFRALVALRQKGAPIQYLVGEWDFMGLPMRCAPGALIPREDTETLAMAAIERAKESSFNTVLDMCCGGGCVAVALAAWGGLSVDAADISAEALAIADENAALNGVFLSIIQSDMFAQISAKYDMITCNPPYIPTGDIAGLDESVRLYEPRIALDGGEDGLDYYRILTKDAPRFLNPGGALLVEIGVNQARDVVSMFVGAGFERLCVIDDLNDIPRVVEGRWGR